MGHAVQIFFFVPDLLFMKRVLLILGSFSRKAAEFWNGEFVFSLNMSATLHVFSEVKFSKQEYVKVSKTPKQALLKKCLLAEYCFWLNKTKLATCLQLVGYKYLW